MMSSTTDSSTIVLTEVRHQPSHSWFPSVRLKSPTSGSDRKMIMNNSGEPAMGGAAPRLRPAPGRRPLPVTSGLRLPLTLTSILSHVILLALLSTFLSLTLTGSDHQVWAMPARIGVSTSEKGVFWPFEIDNNAITNNNGEQNDDSSLYSGQNYIYRAAEKQQQKSQVGSILNWPSSQGGAHLNHAYHNPHRSRTSGAHSIHQRASLGVLVLLLSSLLLFIVV